MMREFLEEVKRLLKETPPAGIKVIGVYSTADSWGIDIIEAESEKAVFEWIAPILNYQPWADDSSILLNFRFRNLKLKTLLPTFSSGPLILIKLKKGIILPFFINGK